MTQSGEYATPTDELSNTDLQETGQSGECTAPTDELNNTDLGVKYSHNMYREASSK